MIFVAVGSLYPFDRLIQACDRIAADNQDQQWRAQIHEGEYLPKHMDYERFMDKSEFDGAIADADFLVGHAGMGLINDALTHQKPLLVVPRLRAEGEHVNDHQIAGAELFRAGGHVLVADSPSDVNDMLGEIAAFVPKPRRIRSVELADEIGQFLRTC